MSMTPQSMEESYSKPTSKSAVVNGREYIIEYSLVKISAKDRLCISIIDVELGSVYKETFEYYDLNPEKCKASLLWMKVLIDYHIRIGKLSITMIDFQNLELKGKFYRKTINECKSISDCAALVWQLEFNKSIFRLQIPKLL